MSDNYEYIMRWHTTIVRRNLRDGWQVVAAKENGAEIMPVDKHYDTLEEAKEMANLYLQSEQCHAVVIE